LLKREIAIINLQEGIMNKLIRTKAKMIDCIFLAYRISKKYIWVNSKDILKITTQNINLYSVIKLILIINFFFLNLRLLKLLFIILLKGLLFIIFIFLDLLMN